MPSNNVKGQEISQRHLHNFRITNLYVPRNHFERVVGSKFNVEYKSHQH